MQGKFDLEINTEEIFSNELLLIERLLELCIKGTDEIEITYGTLKIVYNKPNLLKCYINKENKIEICAEDNTFSFVIRSKCIRISGNFSLDGLVEKLSIKGESDPELILY